VAEAIVDLLEAVEVENAIARFGALAVGARDLLLEPRVEVAAVGQAREVVDAREGRRANGRRGRSGFDDDMYGGEDAQAVLARGE